jgi:hypothetical protein
LPKGLFVLAAFSDTSRPICSARRSPNHPRSFGRDPGWAPCVACGLDRGGVVGHHHPIPCTMRIVNVADDIALALSRMPASGPLKTLIDEFVVVALDSGNQATFAGAVCCRSSSAPRYA